jgi:clan AA aspartic protease (TIGR02281 family)
MHILLKLSFFNLLLILSSPADAQPIPSRDFINTKDGAPLMRKKQFINECVVDMKANDPGEARRICTCMAEKIDDRYTSRQVNAFIKKFGSKGVLSLMQSDTALQLLIKGCYTAVAGNNMFFTKELSNTFKTAFKENIKEKKRGSIDTNKLDSYCDCITKILIKKKVTMKALDDLYDYNTLLFNEVTYSCGGIPVKRVSTTAAWNSSLHTDIQGPLNIDTVQVISIGASTKLKVKIGSFVYVWVLDSGASDLVISDSLASRMMEQKVFSEKDYLGNATYYTANGQPMDCKVYRINQVQVGKFTLNNIILATSPDTQEFLLGNSFLNKFSRWTVDNKNQLLILEK